MTYLPAVTIHTGDDCVNVLQLTDLHLPLDREKQVNGFNCYETFEACLTKALNDDVRCDLIMVTGDLVNEVQPEIYNHIFERLTATGIPFACIAGNHDVTDELDLHLPFEQRQFVAYQPDARLLAKCYINANNWKILLLNSAIPGSVGGKIDPEDLAWLQQQLSETADPVMIAMHHHTVPMTSKWINDHIATGADAFWTLIQQFSQVKAVVNGHVHQQHEGTYGQIICYSTPSTCYQFDPAYNKFCMDKIAKPGYRWLKLYQNGSIDSWIDRLEDFEHPFSNVTDR